MTHLDGVATLPNYLHKKNNVLHQVAMNSAMNFYYWEGMTVKMFPLHNYKFCVTKDLD